MAKRVKKVEVPKAKRGKVTLVPDPEAMPIRRAPSPVRYPEGSARAKRQELLSRERAVREELNACPSCMALRAEAHRLVNEAEDLVMECVEEAAWSRGRVAVKRLVYKEAPPNG